MYIYSMPKHNITNVKCDIICTKLFLQFQLHKIRSNHTSSHKLESAELLPHCAVNSLSAYLV